MKLPQHKLEEVDYFHPVPFENTPSQPDTESTSLWSSVTSYATQKRSRIRVFWKDGYHQDFCWGCGASPGEEEGTVKYHANSEYTELRHQLDMHLFPEEENS